MFKRKKRDSAWEGVEQSAGGLVKLKEAVNEKWRALRSKASTFLTRGGQGFSSQLLTLSEILLDYTCTRSGRVITAALGVTFAFILL